MFLAVITTSLNKHLNEFETTIVQITETFVQKGEMSSSAQVSSNSGLERAVSFV